MIPRGVLDAVRDKEGLAVASSSFWEGSEVVRNSCLPKPAVNELNPSGVCDLRR